MGLFTNSLLLTVAISISFFLFSAGVSESCMVYNKFINVGNDTVAPTNEFKDAVPNQVESGSIFSGVSNVVSSFIDIVKFTLNFFIFITGLVFPAWGCGASLGMPIWMRMLLSLPPFFLLIGIIMKRAGMGDQ